MRKHLLGLMLIAGLAACTSDSDPNPATSGAVADPAGSPLLDAAAAPALPLRAPGSSSFASLPDRGELLAYGGARKSRQSGAYTYHPVALSEEHALNAIASGEMVLATPDGETLRLGYQDHEEHPDGNWTWIGRNDDGSSAVLTFGEKAVFGLVTRGDEQFRVRTDRTGAWVVATDRTRLAPGGGRSDRSDVLMPPEDGALAAAGIRHLQKAEPRASASASPKAAAVIDVLLGYSNGLAQQLGSQSAAQTRMVNLVAAANAAYANSGINMRLRPVHALQVNYADTSDNEETLQQLTGYDASTRQSITPNSAFNALREARDEYGADLVAFVRRYQEPEQNGCGIAWLLGMNGSGIQASRDAEFGYAVISDGEDRDEGDGFSYFCSDFSLAHEFGHLMGQAHNSENAQGRAGVHAYSYGYRETSPSGFFTIMAYPLGEAQVEIAHFANPQVRVLGRPTGVANESDNARSMKTMPIIATFRATVVPLNSVRGDIDGDGKADVIFRNTGNGQNVIWKSANRGTQEAMATTSDLRWTIAGTGDFNGDGKFDVVWRHTSTGQNLIWPGGKREQQHAVTAVTDQDWKIVGVGDFNGDGMSDLLWRHQRTGANVIWRSGSRAQQMAVTGVTNLDWTVVGVGDFDGDGLSDILWRDVRKGLNVIWKGGSRSSQQPVVGVTNTNWVVAGVGDFDGNGVDDILWRNVSTGGNVIWRDASRDRQQAVAPVNLDWTVASVADFDGDGRADIFWRNIVTGHNVYWKAGNRDNQQAMSRVSDLSWKVFD